MSNTYSKLLLLLVLIFPLLGISQTTATNESKFPDKIFSVKILGFDDPWIGVTYEKLVNEKVGIEGQIGLFGASVGVKYYFLAPRIKSVTFSVGASPGYGITGVRAYFPIAVNFWSKRNYRYSFDIGPNISLGNEESIASFSFKIGKGF
ncbi:hypothetical protein N9428_00700 [Flavobacteriaceae bacterium]|nr:hypothetical protein [Flavobacteriaceae bacterium]